MNVRAVSFTYCMLFRPPYPITYGRFNRAALTAFVGSEVNPKSRPGPYTVHGRSPMLEMP